MRGTHFVNLRALISGFPCFKRDLGPTLGSDENLYLVLQFPTRPSRPTPVHWTTGNLVWTKPETQRKTRSKWICEGRKWTTAWGQMKEMRQWRTKLATSSTKYKHAIPKNNTMRYLFLKMWPTQATATNALYNFMSATTCIAFANDHRSTILPVHTSTTNQASGQSALAFWVGSFYWRSPENLVWECYYNSKHL